MSKKLLLADDSVTIQKVIQITFAHEDYDLTVTDNGDAAFDKAREIKPDLVLADVYMPGKNGYELCAALKQDPACQGTPVLLLAGSFEPFDEDKARAAKADAWLEKPFESQTLLDKVAGLLESAETAVSTESPTAAGAESTADTDFEDFSFDEEPSDEDSAIAATSADDWSDLSDFGGTTAEEGQAAQVPDEAEKEVAAATFEADLEAGEEDNDMFIFEDELAEEEQTAQTPDEKEKSASVAESGPGIEAGDEDDSMFVFEDELPEEELPPVAESEPDVFDTDDDIMALDDEDILGAEDLEPLEEEPTLAAWSRKDFVAEETSLADFDAPVEEFGAIGEFGTASEEITGSELDEDFVEPVPTHDQGASLQADESPFDEESSLAEPDFSSAFAEEPGQEDGEEAADTAEGAFASDADADESAAATAPNAGEVESRAAALNEAEIEAIVEKVAGKVIEKMAGTILERIAWEVVPDLAESLIREEINKIKENAA